MFRKVLTQEKKIVFWGGTMRMDGIVVMYSQCGNIRNLSQTRCDFLIEP
jgi:hypothetical protein